MMSWEETDDLDQNREPRKEPRQNIVLTLDIWEKGRKNLKWIKPCDIFSSD